MIPAPPAPSMTPSPRPPVPVWLATLVRDGWLQCRAAAEIAAEAGLTLAEFDEVRRGQGLPDRDHNRLPVTTGGETA